MSNYINHKPVKPQRDYAKLSYIIANLVISISILSVALPASYLFTVQAIQESRFIK